MKANEIVILGIGTAGSRAAYYIYQRGSINGVRVIAADSDAGALATLPGVETVIMPEPGDVVQPDGNYSQQAQQFFLGFHRHLSTARLLILVTCLGRPTGNYYAEELARYAKENHISVAVIAAMPHSFDEPSWHDAAKSVVKKLQEIADTVLPLPNCEFGRLFPDQVREEAYPQAARWIAETAIGFVALFSSQPLTRGESKIKPVRLVDDDGSNQMYLEFKNLPLGIFARSKHSVYNGVNMDIPTFLRQKIEIDDGRP